MSNKVYGFCDAGCRYRVPSYDDFVKSAYIAKITPNVLSDGEDKHYKFNAGETYLVKQPSSDGASWGHLLFFELNYTSGRSADTIDNLPAYDEFADDTLKIKYLGWKESSSGYITHHYEINGVRYTQSQAIAGSYTVADITDSYIFLNGENSPEVYRINDDATLEAVATLTDEDIAKVAEQVATEGFYTSEQVDTLIANAITTTLNTEV